ncbi:MAG: hypothetical protein HYX76_08465 [Acidobacteria bacterium]|nr:hypothetical protein [Acidobacteriota bacterium]
MTTHELLSEVTRLGVVLAVAAERLHVEAPRGVVTPALRETLRARKRELLPVLWRLDAMRRHGVDLTPRREHPDRPPVAVARLEPCGGPGRCFSCGDALECATAYGRCTPCDVAADVFYSRAPSAEGMNANRKGTRVEPCGI